MQLSNINQYKLKYAQGNNNPLVPGLAIGYSHNKMELLCLRAGAKELIIITKIMPNLPTVSEVVIDQVWGSHVCFSF